MSVLAQDSSKKDLYTLKIEKFSKMRNTGIGVTIGGVILTAVGIGVLSSAADMPYDTQEEMDAFDTKVLLGTYTTMFGLAGTGGGIALWSIGGSKKKSYQKKLNTLTFNLNPNPNQKLSLVYKF